MNAIGSESRELQILGEVSLDALLLLDGSRRYIYANEAAERLFGMPIADLLKARMEDFVPPEHRSTFRTWWADLKTNGLQQGEGNLLRPDGTLVRTQYRGLWNFRDGQHLFAARELPRTNARGEELSPRQTQVLQLAANGRSTDEIAEVLIVSPGTIKTHFKHIYERLGAHDRASAVALGIRHGFIE
jgi:PAS domain S-box-containing protein